MIVVLAVTCVGVVPFGCATGDELDNEVLLAAQILNALPPPWGHPTIPCVVLGGVPESVVIRMITNPVYWLFREQLGRQVEKVANQLQAIGGRNGFEVP